MSAPNMITVHRLLGVLRDQGLSTDQKISIIEADPEIGPAELSVLAQSLTVESRDLLSDVRPLSDHGQSLVLDLSIKELGALAAVYSVISRWDLIFTRPEASLSDVIKVLPTDQAEAIVTTLRWARLVDPP